MTWQEKIDDFLEKGFDDAEVYLDTGVNLMQAIEYLKSKGFEDYTYEENRRQYIIELVKDGYAIAVWVSRCYYDVVVCWSRKVDE